MRSLLSVDDFNDLPTEPKARWIAVESISRKRMEASLEMATDTTDLRLIKLQYMKTVTASAKATGVQGISVPGGTDPTIGLNSFLTDVEAAVAEIMLNDGIRVSEFGIRVGAEPKARIRDLVSAIQADIQDLNLTARHEKRLKQALLSFLTELEAPRSRYAIGSSHLVTALTVLNLSVVSVAVGDEALRNLQSVQSIWGEEYEKADTEKLGIEYEQPTALIEAPRLQIEGPKDKE